MQTGDGLWVPAEKRGKQRRYTPLSRFNVFLARYYVGASTGQTESLTGPQTSRLCRMTMLSWQPG